MDSISPSSPLRGSDTPLNYVPLHEFEAKRTADRRAALGNNTKSSSPYGAKIAALTRAITGNQPSEKHEKVDTNRALRYLLLGAARRLHLIAMGDEFADGIEALNNAHRVCKCCHTKVKPNVEIWKSKEYGKAFFGGVSICGSVWVCPVCNAKIQEKRRGEVEQAVTWAYENGHSCSMVTFTFPHYGWQTCKDLLERQAKAFKYLRSGKVWQRIKEEMGYQGLIRSLEVNHGQNGWHPHTHEIWIHKPLSLKSQQYFSRMIHKRWKQACKKFDLIPYGKTKAFDQYATKVDFNVNTSDYLAKMDDSSHWGIDREMAKSSVKESKKGRPPFALLYDYAKGDKKAGELFLEYSAAFKGKSQMFWSKGLKAMVGLLDKSDEDLATEKEDDCEKVIELEVFGWLAVLEEEARFEILKLAEIGGYDAVYDWLYIRGYRDAGFASWSA